MAFGGSAFGSSSPSPFGFNSQPSLFGSTPSNAFPQSNPPFSQQNPPSNTWPSNPNNTPAIPPNGTRAVTYQITTLHENQSNSEPARYVSISAMEPFRPFSLEELRLADYMRGDKGGQQQNSAFQNSFGQSASPFASAPSAFGPTSANAFASSSNPPNLFGAAPNQGPSAPTSFGNPQPNNLFASTPSNPSSAPFGASNALFGSATPANPSNNMGFGSTNNSLFGSSAPSAFGASSAPAFGASAPNLFASSSAFGASSAAFASSSAPSLFGAQSTAGLFGSSQPAGASGFGASSSATGPSGAFGAGFGAQSAAGTAQSLFGASSFGTGFGAPPSSGAGLFGNTASGGFGNTGGGLFGSTGAGMFGSTGGGLFGASSGSSLFGGAGLGGFGGGFGSSFGGGFGINSAQNAAQQQQQPQGPLQASLTNNPFGDSKLFASVTPNPQSAGQGGLGTVGGNAGTAAGQSQQKAVTVVVKRTSESNKRTRSSDLMARQTVMRRNNPATGWFAASPMRPWGENGPVFDMNSAFRSYDGHKGGSRNARSTTNSVTPWRTDEQRMKAANLKKLVIEPMADDPILQGGKSWLTMAPSSSQEERRARAGTSRGRGEGVVTPPGQQPGAPVPGDPFAPEGSTGAETAGEGPQVEQASPPQMTTDANAEETVDEGRMTSEDAQNEQKGSAERTPPQGKTRKLASKTHTGSSAGEEVRLEKFTPYSDFYRRQMAASRRRTSIGSGEQRMSRHRYSHAPISTDPEYYMSPSIQELSEMTSEELSHVDEFTIGRKRKGEITWLEPVDLRRVNLDEVVRIQNRQVSVYPKEEDLVPPGQGLNKPAKVKLFGLYKYDKRTREPLRDASAAAIMVEKLKGHSAEIGVTFLGYEVKTGTWLFQVDRF
eukprot:GFKZ01010679.1.p1 GENE.GFKZ01010679.1~~GFKZ01010679.1.p1  ORF type:complete len:917 (+),score=148.44 GFKZ01010679.1:91-2751(+)